MAGRSTLCWLFFVFLKDAVNAAVCSKKYTVFYVTYTTYFSCPDKCCCGDIEERYCCACGLWWIGSVVGGVIGFIVFVVIVVILICILVKHNKTRNGRVIAPGQPGPVPIGMTQTVATTSGGGYTQSYNTGPQPIYNTYPPPPAPVYTEK